MTNKRILNCYKKLIITLIASFAYVEANASNASYLALSNQIAKKREMAVLANNAANSKTIGFEQENVLFRSAKIKSGKKEVGSFTFAETTYKSGDIGELKTTHNPLDIAIAGNNGYFKILTPRGERYTLDGSMFISQEGVLVNFQGYPYANIENGPIDIPENFNSIEVGQDGTIFVDAAEIDRIGVFVFTEPDSLVKEGNRLYSSSAPSVAMEEYHIIGGALRESNVNSTAALAKMVEMQRSTEMTNALFLSINNLDKTTIDKLTK